MTPGEKAIFQATCVASFVTLALSQGIEWGDRSWVAFGFGYIISPITNGVIALFATSYMLIKRSPQFPIRAIIGIPMCVGIPSIAYMLNMYSLMLMDFRGC